MDASSARSKPRTPSLSLPESKQESLLHNQVCLLPGKRQDPLRVCYQHVRLKVLAVNKAS